MKLRIARRRVVGLLAAAGLGQLPTHLPAQSAGPSKALRIVVGYPAGQTTDIIARTFAAALAKDLGRSVYVDNRPGANGILGAQDVAKATPDGTTLLLGAMSQMAINPTLYKRLPYDPEKDFAPIALVGTGALVLVASPTFPPNNLKELLAYAKARPGKVDYASGGNGITGHLAMEILQAQAGIKLNHIPYKGSPAAMNDVLGGQVPMMFDPIATTLPQIKAGRLKALAVTGSNRSPEVGQDVATLSEQGMTGLEIQSWVAFFAPVATPPGVVSELSAAIRRVNGEPSVQSALRVVGLDAASLPPTNLALFLHQEIGKWGQAVKDANLQID